jgi:antitoxin component YwqK of YwqJK toxin-antitoxin module
MIFKVLSISFTLLLTICSIAQSDSIYVTNFPGSKTKQLEGQLISGKRCGKWVSYRKNSDTLAIHYFVNDHLDSSYHFYKGNKLKSILLYNEYGLDSVKVTRDRKGNTIYSGNVIHGNGVNFIYDEKSRLKSVSHIVNGREHGSTYTFGRNNVLRSIDEFSYGV